MEIKKSSFASYFVNGIPEGCKRCVEGKKLVLFVTGVCSRNCLYCPLSKKRKNIDKSWANEREFKKISELIKETIESKSSGAGITGGDPLIRLEKTLNYLKKLKKKFKNFHIHIYLSTKLVDLNKLKKISKLVDEVRFHPDLTKKFEEEAEKIKMALNFWKKENIGIELPLFPDKKTEIFNFIKKASPFIGFVNLNELEIGETNFDYISKNYPLGEGGYVIRNSKKSGIEILKKAIKEKLNLKLHLCTAETKNWHQYKNRLLNHKILPYGKRTEDGTVIYFITPAFGETKIKGAYFDKPKKRFILPPKRINFLKKKHKIFRVEEYPTFDREEVEREEI
jgi:uncharacterized protein